MYTGKIKIRIELLNLVAISKLCLTMNGWLRNGTSRNYRVHCRSCIDWYKVAYYGILFLVSLTSWSLYLLRHVLCNAILFHVWPTSWSHHVLRQCIVEYCLKRRHLLCQRRKPEFRVTVTLATRGLVWIRNWSVRVHTIKIPLLMQMQ